MVILAIDASIYTIPVQNIRDDCIDVNDFSYYSLLTVV